MELGIVSFIGSLLIIFLIGYAVGIIDEKRKKKGIRPLDILDGLFLMVHGIDKNIGEKEEKKENGLVRN